MGLQPGQMVYYLEGSPPTFIEVGYVIGPVENEHVDDLWRLSCYEPDSHLLHETRAANIFVSIWDALFALETRINAQIDFYGRCLKNERKRVKEMVTAEAK